MMIMAICVSLSCFALKWKNSQYFIIKYNDWYGIFAETFYQNKEPLYCPYFGKNFLK